MTPDYHANSPCPECESYLNHEPWCPFDTHEEKDVITAVHSETEGRGESPVLDGE